MHRFSVAPMMDWTDRHCRYFHRLISKKTQLWSEMITAKAIIHGDKNRLLGFNNQENPIVLQLGGSNPQEMATAGKIGQNFGYDEININVGCPSPRVSSGNFGASLMKEPNLVASCVDAIKNKVNIDVSVKSRIGVDDMDSYSQLVDFIGKVSNKGCDNFIIHARKAWLSGLSPKENRSVPVLKYDFVYKIKNDFPHLNIGINGGIMDICSSLEHLKKVDSVMIGRAIYHNPYLLSTVDEKIYKTKTTAFIREQILIKFINYMEAQINKGVPIRSMTRHILGLYYAQPNAKKFRQILSGKVVKLSYLYKWLECNNG